MLLTRLLYSASRWLASRGGRRAIGTKDYPPGPPRRILLSAVDDALVLHAHELTAADHDVVQHLDAEEPGSLERLPGERHVLQRRVAGRVVGGTLLASWQLLLSRQPVAQFLDDVRRRRINLVQKGEVRAHVVPEERER